MIEPILSLVNNFSPSRILNSQSSNARSSLAGFTNELEQVASGVRILDDLRVPKMDNKEPDR